MGDNRDEEVKLRPVYNRRLGQWLLCHNKWCDKGETSIVATILTGLDPKEDEDWARLICERFNGNE